MASSGASSVENGKKGHYRGESFGNSMPLDNFTSNRFNNEANNQMISEQQSMVSVEQAYGLPSQNTSSDKINFICDKVTEESKESEKHMARSLSKTDSLRDLNSFFAGQNDNQTNARPSSEMLENFIGI